MLVVYPQPAEQQMQNMVNWGRHWGHTDLDLFLKTIFEQATGIYRDSGVDVTFNLVHSERVDFLNINANWQSDLSLALMNSEGNNNYYHQYIDEIEVLRNAHSADIVVYWREFGDGGPSANGAGSIGGGEDEAYIHLTYGGMNPTIVAHETGHLLSGEHGDGIQGATFYSVDGDVSQLREYRTIMTVAVPLGHEQYNYLWRFSDTNATVSGNVTCGALNGVPKTCSFETKTLLGDATHDVVSKLIAMVPVVAAFRGSDVIDPSGISYQWHYDGVAIEGATQNTLLLTQTEVGSTITVAAISTDDLGNEQTVISNPTAVVMNVNDAPTGTVTISGTENLEDYLVGSGGDSIARVLLYDVTQMITHGDLYDDSPRKLSEYHGLFGQASQQLEVPGDVSAQIQNVVDEEVDLLDEKKVIFWADTPYVPPNAIDTTPEEKWASTGHMTVDGRLVAGGHNQLYGLKVDYLDIDANSNYVYALMTLVSHLQDGDISHGQMRWLYERAIMSAVPRNIISEYMAFEHNKANLEDHVVSSGGDSIARVLLYDVTQMITHGDLYDDSPRKLSEYHGLFGQASQQLGVPGDVSAQIQNVVDEEVDLLDKKKVIFWADTPYVSPNVIDTTPKEEWARTGGHMTVDGRLVAGGHNQLYGLNVDYLDINANSNYVYALMTLASHLQDGEISPGQMSWLYERAIMSAVPRNIISEYMAFQHRMATEGHVLTASNNLADADGLGTISYEWNRGGAAINGATASTYTLTHDDVGSAITVMASYIDGEGTAESVTSEPTAEVVNVNDSPVAVSDSFTVAEGETVTSLADNQSSVLANDTDVEGDVLTAVLVSDVTNGSLTLNSDGTFSYTHDGSETTTDSFTYKAHDGVADSNTVEVVITVTPVNDPPLANSDNATTYPGAAITLNLVANDTDVDGTIDASTLVIVSVASNGIVLNNGDGTVTYTPEAGFGGSDRFTYTVKDDDGTTSNEAVVTVVVAPNPKLATWDGDRALGNVGDGTSWSDANNWSWTEGGLQDLAPNDEAPGDDVVFKSSPSVGTIDLESSRTVHSLSFEAGYVLANHMLTVTSGNVAVDAHDVTASIASDISSPTKITKTGVGTLLITGTAPAIDVSAGTLVLGSSATINGLSIDAGTTAVLNGSVVGDVVNNGTLMVIGGEVSASGGEGSSSSNAQDARSDGHYELASNFAVTTRQGHSQGMVGASAGTEASAGNVERPSPAVLTSLSEPIIESDQDYSEVINHVFEQLGREDDLEFGSTSWNAWQYSPTSWNGVRRRKSGVVSVTDMELLNRVDGPPWRG